MLFTYSTPFAHNDNQAILLINPKLLLVLIIGLWLTYRSLRWFVTPRPLQGIPHYGPVGPFGDIGRLLKYGRGTGMRSVWFNTVAKDLGPIAQVMLGWFKLVIVSDAQEMEDILTRRTKEFDRSTEMIKRLVFNYSDSIRKLILLSFSGLVPHSQFSLRTGEPRQTIHFL